MRKIILVLLLIGWMLPVFAANDSVNFLCLTDIHFNPYAACHGKQPCTLIKKLRLAPVNEWANLLAQYDTTQVQFGQDTNYPLLVTALTAAKKIAQEQQAQFILILGDSLGHDYRANYYLYSDDKTHMGYQAFAHKTFKFLSQQWAMSFPGKNVYVAVGNNDSYQDDYVVNPQSAFFQDAKALWSTLITDKTNQIAMRQTFGLEGYYAVSIPDPVHMRLIILDTNLFSLKARGRHIDGAAAAQLAWLRKQLSLARAKQQHVFIAMHIPTSINVGEVLAGISFKAVKFWNAENAAQFEQILSEFADEIKGIFTGHLHIDWSQPLRFHLNEIPMLGTRAISPIFGTEPGFRVYTYSPTTGVISDYTTWDLKI